MDQSSPVLAKLNDQYDKPAEINLDDLAKSVGVDTEKVSNDVKMEQAQVQMQAQPQNQQPQAQKPTEWFGSQGVFDKGNAPALTDKNAKVPSWVLQKDTGDTAQLAGAGMGLADIVQGAQNALIGVGKAVSEYAASHGVTSTDLLANVNKADWANKLAPDSMNPDESAAVQAHREIMKNIAPMMATAGITGPVGMTAAAGATNFLTADNTQERLSNLALKVPGLKNFPAVYNALDWLSHKPGESDLEARLKSAAEGVGLTAGLAGVFHTFAKYSAYIGQADQVEQDMQQMAGNASQKAAKEGAVAGAAQDMAPAVTEQAPQRVMADGSDFIGVAGKLESVPSKEVVLPSGEKIQLKAEMVDSTMREGQSKPGVVAYKDGEKIGHVTIGGEPGKDGNFKTAVSEVFVNEGERRKGVATELYKYADEHVAKLDGPSAVQSGDGEKFTKALQQKGILPGYVPDHPLYNYEPTFTSSDGETRVNPNNSMVSEALQKVRQQEGFSLSDLLHVPTTYAERNAEASKLAQDSSFIERLANRKKGDPLLTGVETTAVQYILKDAQVEFNDARKALLAAETPENKVRFANARETWQHLMTIETGMGSEQSIALDANKQLADLKNMTPQEVVAQQTEKQRQKFMKDVIRANGGDDALMEEARQFEAIASMDPQGVEKLMAIMDAQNIGKFKRFSNVLASAAVNGMLSSLKTAMGNHLSNLTTFSKGIADAYSAATIGAVKNAVKGSLVDMAEAHIPGSQWLSDLVGKPSEAVSFTQANAQLTGSMMALKEAWNAMGDALKYGKGGPANVINPDILQTMGALSSKNLMPGVIRSTDPFYDGFMALGEKYGLQAATPAQEKLMGVLDKADRALNLPSRINATADSFWGTLMYRGKLKSMAVAEAENLGLKGEEATSFIQDFTKNPNAQAHELAQAYAAENTFSKGLRSGSLSEGLQDGVFSKFPLGRVLFPFFKTQANIIEYTVKNTPALALIHPEVRQAIAAGGKEADMAIAKMGTGTMLLGMFAYEAATGGMTGVDTRSGQMKQALAEPGTEFTPFALHVVPALQPYLGERMDLHRVQPFNTFQALGSYLATVSGHLPAEEYHGLVMATASHLAATMTPEMMVGTWSDYLEAISSFGKMASEPNRTNVGNATRSGLNAGLEISSAMLPYGGLMRDVKQVMDPTKRDTSVVEKDLDSFLARAVNRYKAQIPGLSADLPALRNIFGEKIQVPAGVGPDLVSPVMYSSPGTASDTTKMLNKMGGFYEDHKGMDPDMVPMNIAMPPRYFMVNKTRVDLTPQEYEKYVMYTAGLDPKTEKPLPGAIPLKETMDKTLKSIAPMMEKPMSIKTYKQISGMVHGVFAAANKAAEARMLQDPEIMKRWSETSDSQLKLRQMPGITER